LWLVLPEQFEDFTGLLPLVGALFIFLRRTMMWKIVIGFIAFAALALYMLTKGGDLDMGGEKHGAAPSAVELKA
jgi:hypothetical protein